MKNGLLIKKLNKEVFAFRLIVLFKDCCSFTFFSLFPSYTESLIMHHFYGQCDSIASALNYFPRVLSLRYEFADSTNNA